jgi:SAM-dependent methyltransferase
MKDYWNNRFKDEGVIWSNNSSQSALFANKKFKDYLIKNILILGIGYGRNARPFIENGYVVSGIEIADEAIKILNNSDLKNKIEKIYQGSLLDIPFDNKHYDAIFSFNVIHLFKEFDRYTIIEKCRNILNPNGLIFFTAMSELDFDFGKGVEIENSTFDKKGKPVHFFNDSDIKEHFKDFDLIETGLINEPEKHGESGDHIHKCRYIFAKTKEVKNNS